MKVELNIISLIQILVFYGYVITSRIMLGPLNSISETYYLWQAKNNSRLFFIFTVLVGGLMIPNQYFYFYKPMTGMILILSGLALISVSIAAVFREPKVGRMHYAASVVAIAGGFLAIIIEYGWIGWACFGVYLGSLAYMIIRKRRDKSYNFTTATEIWAFSCIFAALLIQHPL